MAGKFLVPNHLIHLDLPVTSVGHCSGRIYFNTGENVSGVHCKSRQFVKRRVAKSIGFLMDKFIHLMNPIPYL